MDGGIDADTDGGVLMFVVRGMTGGVGDGVEIGVGGVLSVGGGTTVGAGDGVSRMDIFIGCRSFFIFRCGSIGESGSFDWHPQKWCIGGWRGRIRCCCIGYSGALVMISVMMLRTVDWVGVRVVSSWPDVGCCSAVAMYFDTATMMSVVLAMGIGS